MRTAFGLFTVSQDNHILTANSWIEEIVGMEPDHDLSHLPVEEFFSRLISITEDPVRAQSALDIGRSNVEDYPVINLSVRQNEIRHLQLFIFPGVSEAIFAWGGLILDRTRENDEFIQQVKILEELSTEARKISASLGGNVDALSGNINTWTGEIIEDFLLGIKQQVGKLNERLDQLLLVERSLDRFQLFPERMSFGELLNSVLRTNREFEDRIMWILPDEMNVPAIQVDPGITKIAFEYIFKEMLGVIPQEQQINLSVQVFEDGLNINLRGKFPLTLPGLEEELVSIESGNLNIRMQLARRIIHAQGGEMIIKSDHNEPGMDFNVDLKLPTVIIHESSTDLLAKQDLDQMQSARILLADAHPEYQALLLKTLENRGYRVDLAIEGRAALDLSQRINPDLVLIDRNLPELDGILVTQGIRRWSSVPIIMISSRTNPDDLIHAFQTGVDDYIQKPFQVDEVLVRIQSVIRRGKDSTQAFTPETFTAGDVRINYSTRQVWIRTNLVELTPIEFNLLSYMSRHRRQVLPYEQLIERTWAGPEKGTRQGLFVHIRRLREKIELDKKEPKIIQNKWGVGYIFSP